MDEADASRYHPAGTRIDPAPSSLVRHTADRTKK
jgi:hypothetical protein